MEESLFPKIKKSVTDLIHDEEGNIPRSKLVMIGSTIMLMGMMMGIDTLAAHSSHRSHSSHYSHASTSYHRSHVSHSSHTSGYHGSHDNTHSSHASHDNTHASHNNTHSNVAHVNSNTTPSHMNTAGGSVPGTAQIPVPQKPQSNTFMKDLPKTAAAVPFSMKPGTTKKPD